MNTLFNMPYTTDCKACSLFKECIHPNIKPVGNKDSPILLVGEAPGCITGDSLIDTAFRDKSKYPNGIPISKLAGSTNTYVYSFDIDRQQLVVGKANKIWKTGRKRVFKVTYEWCRNTKEGKEIYKNSIKVTKDHKFLLRKYKAHSTLNGLFSNSEYLSIKDGLAIGHSIQPIYRHFTSYGYSLVGTWNGEKIRESRFLLEYKLGRGLLNIKEQCHHIDRNKINDNWENIINMGIAEHTKLHDKEDGNCMFNSLVKEKHKKVVANTLREKYKNPEFYYSYLMTRTKIIKRCNMVWVEDKFKERFPYEDFPPKNNHIIISIEDAGYEDVFDIEVKKYHNFAVNGIFVHNSSEDKEGEPFIGRAGMELNDALAEAGLNRSSILITNACRCYPIRNKNKKPTNGELKKCGETHLYPLINRIKPKLIITLGNFALKSVTGLEGITKRQNIPFYSIKHDCLILPIVHPARILRSNNEIERKKFRYGFSLVRKLLKTGQPLFDYGKYTVLRTPEQLSELTSLIRQHKLCCFDIEALSLDVRDPDNIMTAFGFSYRNKESFLIPFSDGFPFEEGIKWIKEIMEDGSIRKIAQNIKWDSSFLKERYNIKVVNWYCDTMVAHFLLDETIGTHNLKDMVFRYLPKLAGYDATVEAEGGAHMIQDTAILYKYCMCDVDSTFRLYLKFKKLLIQQSQWRFFIDYLMPAHYVLYATELNGIRFNKKHLLKLQKKYDRLIKKAEAKMSQLEGVQKVEIITGHKFNPAGKDDLLKLLFDYYKLPVLERTKKANLPSTTKEIIQKYAEDYNNPYCKLLTDYRAKTKLKSTYIDNILKRLEHTDIIHPEYHLTMTKTGRTSSKNPSAHTIPRQKDTRNIVYARPGHVLIGVDFPQSEIRVAAMISNDKKLQQVCNDLSKDFHTYIASVAFRIPYDKVTKEDRQAAKGISFGILYGMGAAALSKTINTSKEEAQGLIYEYFDAYRTLKQWIDSTIRLIKTQGYVVSPFGRRRRFPDYKYLDEAGRARAEREGVNAIIQVTSSDLLLITMTRVFNRLKELESTPIIEVHDSIIIDTAKGEIEVVGEILKEEVAGCTKGFPWAERVVMFGELELGKSWGELEKI